MKSTTLPSVLIVSAPSGAGKTTLINLLSKKHKLKFSVSHTTRQRRDHEIEGVHYHFITVPEFINLEKAGAFLETACIHGNYYGTAWKNLVHAHEDDSWIVLDIDIQGFKNIKEKYPQATSVFILPPSIAVLKERILKRQPDIDLFDLEKRLKIVGDEIKECIHFDYIVYNEDVDTALDELCFIVSCEKLRTKRRQNLISLLGY